MVIFDAAWSTSVRHSWLEGTKDAAAEKVMKSYKIIFFKGSVRVIKRKVTLVYGMRRMSRD